MSTSLAGAADGTSLGSYREWLPGVAFFAVLSLTAAVYWPGLVGPLILDDWTNLAPFMEMETGELAWSETVVGGLAGPLGRPVAMLSFLGNWLASSGDPWQLKYTNLMLHLLCGALAFWLVGRLLLQPQVHLDKGRWWLALWIAAMWLLAPLLVSTVLYVVQRMAILSALFVFAGLLCYVIGRQVVHQRRILGVSLILLGFLAFLPLASFSKENGLLLPLLAFVIEAFFFRFEGDRRVRRFVAGVFAVFLLLPAVVAAIKIGLDPGWLTDAYALRGFTLYERLLTQPRILFDYASSLLIPRGPGMGIFHDDYVKSIGLLRPPVTLISQLACLGTVAVAVVYRNSRFGLVMAGSLFFMAGHSMESSFLALELYFEHRNYLPGFGIFLGLGLGAYYLMQSSRYRRPLFLLLALLPVGYAAASYQRAHVWDSWPGILMAAEHSHPDSSRLHTAVATLHMENGQLDVALNHLDRVEETLPSGAGLTGTLLHRLLAYCLNGRPIPDSEYSRLETVPRHQGDVYTVNGLEMIIKAVDKGRCDALDIQRLTLALERGPVNSDAQGENLIQSKLMFYMARLLGMSGRPRTALGYLETAHALYPSRLAPLLLRLQYQVQVGDFGAASRTLDELKARDNGRRRTISLSIKAYEQFLGEALRGADRHLE